MVKGFMIKSNDAITVHYIKKAMAKLPAAMEFRINSDCPFIVEVTPKEDRVKLAMYKDSLNGPEGKAIRERYLDTFRPFLKAHIRDLSKLEVYPYD